MEILLHKDKHGKTAYKIDPEKPDEAYLKMFRYLSEQEYYAELHGRHQIKYYKEAKDGDARSARNLIALRSDYEYEEYEVLTVVE